MIATTTKIDGKRYVLIEESELRRLRRLAVRAEELPPLPSPDRNGNRPALAFLRASIARDIIAERKALGLTQEELARLAGIRTETLSRIESAKHSPTVRTVEKIERALQKATQKQSPTIRVKARRSAD